MVTYEFVNMKAGVFILLSRWRTHPTVDEMKL